MTTLTESQLRLLVIALRALSLRSPDDRKACAELEDELLLTLDIQRERQFL